MAANDLVDVAYPHLTREIAQVREERGEEAYGMRMCLYIIHFAFTLSHVVDRHKQQRTRAPRRAFRSAKRLMEEAVENQKVVPLRTIFGLALSLCMRVSSICANNQGFRSPQTRPRTSRGSSRCYCRDSNVDPRGFSLLAAVDAKGLWTLRRFDYSAYSPLVSDSLSWLVLSHLSSTKACSCQKACAYNNIFVLPALGVG